MCRDREGDAKFSHINEGHLCGKRDGKIRPLWDGGVFVSDDVPGQNNSKLISPEETRGRKRESEQETKTKRGREREREAQRQERRSEIERLGQRFLTWLTIHRDAVLLQRCPVVLTALQYQGE